MVCLYSEEQKSDSSLFAFWTKHSTMAYLFLSEDNFNHLQQLTEVKGSKFRPYLQSLRLAKECSKLGKVMFGWALPCAYAEEVAHVVEQRCLWPAEGMTVERVEQIIQECRQELAKIDADSVLGHKKRKIQVQYRVLEITAVVSSVSHEIRLRVIAWLKSRCAGLGLPLMSFEEVIIPVEPNKPASPCKPGVLNNFIDARARADKALQERPKEKEDGGMDDIRAYLIKRRGVWMTLDPSFCLELGMLAAICGGIVLRQSEGCHQCHLCCSGH